MDKKEQKKGKGKAGSTLKDLRPKKDATVKGGTTTINTSKSNTM